MTVETINLILNVGFVIFIFGGMFFLIYTSSRRTPFFSHRCKKCGKKDKNWDVVPTGHDDFGWQHNCDSKKPEPFYERKL